MIKLKNLSLTKGDFSLQDINLNIKEGEIHALLGPSGAGKSSILNAILGLAKIDRGSILLDNKDITNLAVDKRGFGYVPQNLALFPHMSVRDNILYGLNALSKSDRDFNYIVEIANLENLLNRYPSSLSGGEKQRVALARAFVIKPKVLLLDEPFNALDTKLKQDLWRLLKLQSKIFKTTVIVVTHDLNEAYYLSDSISVVINGKIAQSAPKIEVFNRPATLDVAKYLGISNIYVGRAKDINEVYIDNFSLKFKIKDKLNKNSNYIVVFKDKGIKFVKNSNNLENIIKGDIDTIIELEYYNIINFITTNPYNNKEQTIRFIANKDYKRTNYIQVPPENIICYEK